MSSTITIDELKTDFSFQSDLLLDETFVIIPAEVKMNDEVLKALRAWEFKSFTYEGKMYTNEESPAPSEIPGSKAGAQTAIPSGNPFKMGGSAGASGSSGSDGTSVEIDELLPAENSESTRYESVQKTYQEYMQYINSVYTHYSTHKKIDFAQMTETVQKLCIFIKDNKRFVLRISPSAEARSKNFLVIHSMRSTVLAITIGLELHLPLSKVVELGIATILHEIGMLRLPPQLYITDRALNMAEKKQISMHPVFSYNILKELNFPNTILNGVLDHHEKENGLGYPRGFTSEKISPYGKIISVACSFDAITAPRTYKTERTTYDAMVEMLQNPNKQYDPTIIKALLNCLSLYPIGSYVYLNNGKIGLVSDVTPNKPLNPIVQLVNEKEADGSPKTVQSGDGANKIIRVLSKQEEEELLKKIQVQKAAEEASRPKEAAPKAGASVAPSQNQSAKPTQNGFSSVDLSEFN